MAEFEMDKAGVVNGMVFADLTPIFQGYVEAMLFTETASGGYMSVWAEQGVQEDLEEGMLDGHIPSDSGWGDIHPETAERMQLDCFNFEVEARDLLTQAYARGYERAQAGRDFWFTRNGHGVGFWDRKELEANGLGRALSDIAGGYGQVDAHFAPNEESPTGYGYIHLD
jgi:hypothetical protein